MVTRGMWKRRRLSAREMSLADVHPSPHSKSGCNTLICQLLPFVPSMSRNYNMNECVEKNITGIPVKFCCCNDADYCATNEWKRDGLKEQTLFIHTALSFSDDLLQIGLMLVWGHDAIYWGKWTTWVNEAMNYKKGGRIGRNL
ncbi:hypothetical protein COOONC_18721 [Cooperia oncophora]